MKNHLKRANPSDYIPGSVDREEVRRSVRRRCAVPRRVPVPVEEKKVEEAMPPARIVAKAKIVKLDIAPIKAQKKEKTKKEKTFPASNIARPRREKLVKQVSFAEHHDVREFQAWQPSSRFFDFDVDVEAFVQGAKGCTGSDDSSSRNMWGMISGWVESLMW